MFLAWFHISIFNLWACENRSQVSFVVGFSVSEQIYLLKISFVLLSFSNELFGVVSPFSTALLIPSGFSDRRFETAPDLSFRKHVKLVLAKR